MRSQQGRRFRGICQKSTAASVRGSDGACTGMTPTAHNRWRYGRSGDRESLVGRAIPARSIPTRVGAVSLSTGIHGAGHAWSGGSRRAPTLIRGDRTQQGNCWFLPRAFAPTAARLELVSPFLETAQSGMSRRTLRRNLPVWQGTASLPARSN